MSNLEAVKAFLAPFVEGPDGYIGFTKADRSLEEHDHEYCKSTDDKNCPNKKWSTFNNWYSECAAGDVDVRYETIAEEDVEYYFTPAVLAEPSRLQSKFQHSNAIWIDFDKEVNWLEFDPAPSIVVQTSKTKFHCYWLLDWRITNGNDMRYWCKRFLEFFSGGDPSGFDATQLLKLPIGRNLKIGAQHSDGTPWSPKVVKFAPDLRYPEVAFEHIPEPSTNLVDAVDMSALPDLPESEGGWQFYLEMHRNSIPAKIEAKVRTPQEGGEEKRSGALYNLTCDLFEVLDNPEDVYHILLGSPNDKFTADHGPKGSILLWKDVNRVAIKHQKQKSLPKLAKGLKLIQDNNDMSPSQKTIEKTAYVMDKMLELGKFIQTRRGECFYIDQRADAPLMYGVNTDHMSPFATVLRRRFGMNEGADKTAITGILHAALDQCRTEKSIEFNYFSYYDERSNLVYIDRYDGFMYVLNGEKVELQPHGYNDVFFYQTIGEEFPRPFEYVADYAPGGLDALILDGPNFTIQGSKISRKELRHLLKTWVASFFFPNRMHTKPIVLIHGGADSGKTTMFQNLSVMFTGDSTFSVTELPSDKREFNVQVTQSPYIFYDNVEVNKKELQEKLAQVATGFTVKMRKYYTNNEMISDKARAFVGITSRTLDRIQDDVASRYLLVPVHPFRAASGGEDSMHRRSMTDILQEVTSKRDDLWSELMDFVNSILKQIGSHGWPDAGSELRMADYANLLDITSSIVGLSPRKIENFILSMQSHIVSENDTIFDAMRAILESPGHDPEKRFTSQKLYEYASRVNRKVRVQYPNNNKFAAQLRIFMNNGQLEREGILVKRHHWGKNLLYSVEKLEFAENED